MNEKELVKGEIKLKELVKQVHDNLDDLQKENQHLNYDEVIGQIFYKTVQQLNKNNEVKENGKN
jgi:5-methylcytosine-specific restriction endonuclease McrBC regulatory subunit McrC